MHIKVSTGQRLGTYAEPCMYAKGEQIKTVLSSDGLMVNELFTLLISTRLYSDLWAPNSEQRLQVTEHGHTNSQNILRQKKCYEQNRQSFAGTINEIGSYFTVELIHFSRS